MNVDREGPRRKLPHEGGWNGVIQRGRLYSSMVFCDNSARPLRKTKHLNNRARKVMGSDRAGANRKRREKRNLKNIKTQEKKQAAAGK